MCQPYIMLKGICASSENKYNETYELSNCFLKAVNLFDNVIWRFKVCPSKFVRYKFCLQKHFRSQSFYIWSCNEDLKEYKKEIQMILPG